MIYFFMSGVAKQASCSSMKGNLFIFSSTMSIKGFDQRIHGISLSVRRLLRQMSREATHNAARQ